MGRVAERRASMRERVVTVALDVMEDEGAAGLTLGEVARRLGMRTPSLYGYFDSRAALCDEIFARGWGDLGATVADLRPSAFPDVVTLLEEAMRRCVIWALSNPGHSQLMFWRPIAGWQPTEKAFAPAVATMAHSIGAFAEAQRLGWIEVAHEPEEIAQVWAALVAGVISQQLSNEPGIPAAQGRASRHMQTLARMFAAHYSPRSTS